MGANNPETRYSLISRLLHWAIALLFISLLALGWIMVDLGYYDPLYHQSLTWHKSLGILIGLLVFLKLGWRLAANHPVADGTLSRWETFASKTAHGFLFAAMVVLPLSGYFISSSAGDAIEVFSWFNVPAIFEISTYLRDLAISMHYYIAYIALAVIVAHIAGALKHHFIDKKDTLKRMF